MLLVVPAAKAARVVQAQRVVPAAKAVLAQRAVQAAKVVLVLRVAGGAGAAGAGGEGGAGGMADGPACDDFMPCGGDVTGDWNFATVCGGDFSAGEMPVDFCPEGTVERSAQPNGRPVFAWMAP